MIEIMCNVCEEPKITVIGVGGGGNNAVNRLVEANLTGVNYVAVNTDTQVLNLSKADEMIQIGAKSTRGYGAGANPEIGEMAALENEEELKRVIEGADMCILTCGIDCGYVKRTKEANTSLAFVALKEDGNRGFSFYRKPGADMLLKAEDVKSEWFDGAYALHFCSVSLGDFPMKEAHRKAIQCALEAGALVSFDPNLRFALWDDHEALRKVIQEFMPMAHVLKISDEELEFITGKSDVKEALPELFAGNTKLVIYTKGSEGAECYTKAASGSAASQKVKAVDTTGAGDGFIGSFLYCMAEDGVTAKTIEELNKEKMEKYLAFANKFCGISVTKHGAIASYPSLEEMR